MEFSNQNIVDILLVLARESGNSIIPDETVEGKSSFYFSDQTIQQALNNFLESNNLYSVEENNVIKVSKIKCIKNTVNNTISVSANFVEPQKIIDRISRITGKTILYDFIPAEKMLLQLSDVTVKDALETIVKKTGNLFIEENSWGYYIRKNKETNDDMNMTPQEFIQRNGNLYSMEIKRGDFLSILRELLGKAEKEYSIFYNSHTEVENLYFYNKTFEELLILLLEQSNADFVKRNEIYYILEISKKNKSGKYRQVEIYETKWLGPQEAIALIPQENITAYLKADKNSNMIFITGTREEIEYATETLKSIDICRTGIEYKTVELKSINAKDAIGLIPQKFLQTPPVQIGQTNSILLTGTKEKILETESFLKKIDIEKKQFPIKLKYLKAEELLKNIPPSINKDEIVDSGFPNLVFFTGTESGAEKLKEQLELIDKPRPQIKYQVLVVEYKRNKGKVFKPSISAGKNEDESAVLFAADLTNIMALNFDVISKFGYEFAAILNSQISENIAKVFTDTTLNAISDQEIKFQNTDTYRYIEYSYDKTTGNTTNGTTQQITSGLIVTLTGWISGDNMITMNVNATISKQNGDNMSGTGETSLTALPSTSERIITTQVRTKSGEPVVISGLLKEDENKGESRIPLISKIPGIGELFKQTSESRERTEIVIYIVPHLIVEKTFCSSDNYEKIYKSFIKSKENLQ